MFFCQSKRSIVVNLAIIAIAWMGAIAVEARPTRSLLITPKQYRALSQQEKFEYIRGVRASLLKLEQDLKVPLAANESGAPGHALLSLLLPEADALDANYCAVGGVARKKVASSNGTLVCPTYGRECGGRSGTFKCGVINGSACVDRFPLENLSQRCHEAGAEKVPSAEEFGAVRETVDEIERAVCSGDDTATTPCGYFKERLRSLRERFSQSPASPPPPAEEPPPVVQAPVPPPPVVAPPPPTNGAGIEPPPGAVAPVPAAPPATAGPPPAAPAPASSATDNCKAAYSFLIEGTTETGGGAEHSFHNQVADLAEALAQTSSDVAILPPGEQVTKLKGLSSEGLGNEIKNSANKCDLSAKFLRFIQGTDPYSKRINVDANDFKRYGLGEFNDGQYRPRDMVRDSGNPNARVATLSGFDPSRDRIDSDKGPSFVKKAKDLIQRCGTKADQIVTISVNDHGSSDCRVALGENRSLNPEQAYANLIKPLADMGIKVHFSVNACYSGCFVEKLQSKVSQGGRGVCLTSQTRARTVGYGSDVMIGWTFDSTYPTFLRKLKDPFKAFLCATALDPLNEPQMGTTRSLGPQEKSGNVMDEAKAQAVFDKIGAKTGTNLANLGSACASIRGGADFPRNGLLSQMEAREMFACTDVKSGLAAALGQDEAHAFIEAIANRKTWPGLDALNKLADNNRLKEIFGNCSVNLADYVQKPVGSAQGSGGSGSGKAQ